MKIFKIILCSLFLLIATIGGYISYFLFFHNDIEITKANSNEQSLNSFSLTNTILTNIWEDTITVQQGTLVVPENRSKEKSNNISISFLRIPSSNPKPTSPIFFLPGGPGTPASSIARRAYFYLFKKLSEYADVILIDQRGTGKSIPNLRCRNQLAMPTERAANIEAAILEDVVEKCKECAHEFKGLGIDLSGYTSEESAIDIEEVRKALQLDSIILFGYSYGTTLAQHYVSLFEGNVHKLIFAGTTAPDLGLKQPEHLEQQYHQMDSLIKADKKISKYIPSFTHLMQEQHARLKEQPLEIKLPLMDAVGSDDGFLPTNLFRLISLFKPSWDLTLSDVHMMTMMAQNSGTSNWTQIAPSHYYNLSKGEYNRLGNYLRNFRRQNMPNALFFTVNASTSYDQKRWNWVSAQRPKELVSHFSVSFGRHPEVFETFGVKKVAGFNQPVSSDKELLLIAGTLDGRTPLTNMDSVYNRFPNARKIIIKNASHNDLIDAEVIPSIIDFINGGEFKNRILSRKFEFIAPVPYKYAVSDTLESIRKASGIKKALDAFLDIRNDHLEQEDYLFDLTEFSLNAYGYQLLGNKFFDDAVEVFQFNKALFPKAYNTYNSLAEGLLAQGDTSQAIANLQKALELNYLDGYSHQLLQQITSEQ